MLDLFLLYIGNTLWKGETHVELLKKASLNDENLSSSMFCWKLLVITSEIIMSNLVVYCFRDGQQWEKHQWPPLHTKISHGSM